MTACLGPDKIQLRVFYRNAADYQKTEFIELFFTNHVFAFMSAQSMSSSKDTGKIDFMNYHLPNF